MQEHRLYLVGSDNVKSKKLTISIIYIIVVLILITGNTSPLSSIDAESGSDIVNAAITEQYVNKYEKEYKKIENMKLYTDITNEDGQLSWDLSALTSSLVHMYEATGNMIYLDRFVKYTDKIMESQDYKRGINDFCGQSSYGWSSAGSYALSNMLLKGSNGNEIVKLIGKSVGDNNSTSIEIVEKNGRTILYVHRSIPYKVINLTGIVDYSMDQYMYLDAVGNNIQFVLEGKRPVVSRIRIHDSDNSGNLDINSLAVSYSYNGADFISFDSKQLSYDTDSDSNGHYYDIKLPLTRASIWRVNYTGSNNSNQISNSLNKLVRFYKEGNQLEEKYQNLSFDPNSPDYIEKIINENSKLIEAKVLTPYKRPVPINNTYMKTDEYYKWPVMSGLAVEPILEFIEAVDNNPELVEKYGQVSHTYLEEVKKIIREHDDEWVDNEDGTGYYVISKGAPVWCNGVGEPHNHQLALGKCLLLLYDITKDDAYKEKAGKMAELLKKSMSYDVKSDSYSWYYWYGEASSGWRNEENRYPHIFKGNKVFENISHASITIDFVVNAYEQGLFFNKEDVKRFCNTFLVSCYKGNGKFSKGVNGLGAANDMYKFSSAQWVILSPYNRKIYEICEKTFNDINNNQNNYLTETSANLNIISLLAKYSQIVEQK